MKKLLLISMRNIFRQKRRTLLTFLIVTVGVWSCLALATLARGIGNQMSSDAIKTFLGSIQIHTVGYLDDPVIHHRFVWSEGDALATFFEEKKLRGYTARLRVSGVVMSERESLGVTILGVDPKMDRPLTFLRTAPISGRFLETPQDKGIILGRKLAEKLQVQVGKRVVLMSEDANGVIADRGMRIVGIYDAEVEATEKVYVLVGRDVLQKMLGVPGEVTEISLVTKDRGDIPEVLERLRAEAGELEAKSWDEINPMIGSMLKLQDGVLFLWFGIVVVAVVFGLVNTIFMTVMERTKELGMMLALGLPPKNIIFMIACESFFLLVTGAILGTSLTGLTTYLLRDGIDLSDFARGIETFGAASVVYPTPLAKDWVAGNLMIVFFGLLGSLYPAWRASQLSPVEAIRHE